MLILKNPCVLAIGTQLFIYEKAMMMRLSGLFLPLPQRQESSIYGF